MLVADTLIDVNFWRGIVMIFCGILPAFGVRILATWVWDARWVRPAKSRHKSERQRLLSEALIQAAEHNIQLIDVIHKSNVNEDRMPPSNVDLTVLDSTAAFKWELLSLDVCRKVEAVRFDLIQLHRVMNLWINLQFDAEANVYRRQRDTGERTRTYDQLNPILMDMARKGLENCRLKCQELIGELRKELAEIEGKG